MSHLMCHKSIFCCMELVCIHDEAGTVVTGQITPAVCLLLETSKSFLEKEPN